MSSFKNLTGIALLFCMPAAMADEIQGVVQDSLGRPIAGAALSLKTVTKKVIGKTQSDAQGRFRFSNMDRGIYAVEADKAEFQTGVSIVNLSKGKDAETRLTLAAKATQEVRIAAKRRDTSRNIVSAKTGGSGYRFDEKNIQEMPQGEATPLNEVLLQAPGVVNDSNGQLHVRGDHGDLQYRINGVILPDGISGFGQALDARFAQSINLLTGALPAQHGFRTAGVIEINTKNQFQAGGNIDLYGGSFGTFNPSFEYGNTVGNFSYFVDGSFLRNDVGIASPTPGNPLHDQTEQRRGFAYLSYLVDPTTKVSLMSGVFDGSFQIPNNPGQPADPNNLGIGNYMNLAGLNSANLNDMQIETNRFVVASLSGSISDRSDYQISLFTRYSSFHYIPDIQGNLAFNGTASDLFRSSTSSGIQADSSYRLNDAHTLRMGLFGSIENIVSNNIATVFPVNQLTGLVSGSAYTILDNNSKNGNTLFGAYLLDEWKLTDKLTVNYGGRFDSVSAYVNEQQFSPRLNVTYNATQKTTLHAGFARYFTPPPTELVSTSDLALFSGTTNAANGLNSPVRSERDDYLDAGLTHQLTSTVSLGADAFYKKSQNTLDEGQFGPALLMTPFNYAEGKIYGVELSGNYTTEKVTAYANLARTVSQATNIISSQYLFDQATLDYAANNWVNVDHQQSLTISTGGSYLMNNGTRLNGDLIFESGLRNGFANTTSLPSYTVLNLGMSRKFDLQGVGPLEARLVMTNVLDKIYEIRDGSGIGVFAPQYGLRRGLFAGLTRNF